MTNVLLICVNVAIILLFSISVEFITVDDSMSEL